MPAPTAAEAMAFANRDGSAWTEPEAGDALATEKASQALKCRVPDDEDDWPADLAEALLRRVQRNLATTTTPLGVTPADDKEIQRLEAGHRRTVVG